jgi:hypothetical protein
MIETETSCRSKLKHLATNNCRLSGRSLFAGLTNSTDATRRRSRFDVKDENLVGVLFGKLGIQPL